MGDRRGRHYRSRPVAADDDDPEGNEPPSDEPPRRHLRLVDVDDEFAILDELPDLTDRRRLLVNLIFGVDVADPNPIFEPDDGSGDEAGDDAGVDA